MKKPFLILSLLFIIFNFKVYGQTNSTIGINIVPLILNKTVDLQYDLKIDHTKFITFSLGTTQNNHQSYAFCIQCPLRPKVIELDAYSTKINFRKTNPTPKGHFKYWALGVIGSYYEKTYRTEPIPDGNGTFSSEIRYRNRIIGSLNAQVGKNFKVGRRNYIDLGIQLNTPIKYTSEEPTHYTPTRGMTGINFYSILKFSTKRVVSLPTNDPKISNEN